MTQQSIAKAHPAQRDGWGSWLAVIGIAVTFTVLFWGRLWNGGTLIGGDTFSYYFPQKTFLTDSLKRGEFPLWNPLVGAGYPVVAESQTGLLYPPTLLFYRLLEVNVAYSANQLLHYIIAFTGMWAVGRRYRLSWGSSVLAALIYVYGWFAPRICLEWAIIGGAYLPWCVWLLETWRLTGNRRTLLWLAPVLGLFLLAGHFHLAFITTLALSAYVLLSLFWRETDASALSVIPPPLSNRWSGLAWFGGILLAGYLLAAVQLGPTLELMTRSQRLEFNQGNDPGYGHIPPWYLTQVLSSWLWYSPDSHPIPSLSQFGALAYPCDTNWVEAHLYFGMVPLLIMAIVIAMSLIQSRWPFPLSLTFWMVIGAFGLLLAIGWPFVLLKYFPGFGYFRGAGRYGILTAFAASLLAGASLDGLLPSERRLTSGTTTIRATVWLCVMGLTTWDLYLVSRWVTYAVMTLNSFVPMRNTSELRVELARFGGPVRLWAPGADAATLLATSAWPVYLGLGPQEYFDPDLSHDYHEERDRHDPVAVARQVDWLRRNGVTHILSFDSLNEMEWSVKLVYRGYDRLLSQVWARTENPLSLYELIDAPGRVVDGQGKRLVAASFQQAANELTLTLSTPIDTTVVVRELAYPGWEVTVDGSPATSRVMDSMYRGVDVQAGHHSIQWKYRPRSLWIGLSVSGLACIAWLLVFWSLGRSTNTLSVNPWCSSPDTLGI